MPQALLLLLLLSCVALAQQQQQQQPVFVSQVAPDYAHLTLSDVEFSLPCQHFTDLGGRYISTALPVTVPGGYIYDVLGVQFDFVIGRRPASLSSIMLFDWDGEALLATALGSTVLQWQMDCDGLPCGPPQTPVLTPTRAYKDVEYPWGWLYKIDFILPQEAPFSVASPGLADPFTIWFNLSIAFPSYDINSGYRYKVMQPVIGGNSTSVNFTLQDPYNLLGHNWTDWTLSSDAIRTTLLGQAKASPIFGHRVAAYVKLYDSLVETGQETPSPPSLLYPTPSDAGGGGVVGPPTTTTTILQPWKLVLIVVGAALAFIVIVLLVVFAGRYVRRRYCGIRRVVKSGNLMMDSLYSFPVDGEYNPLDDQDHSSGYDQRSVVLGDSDEEWKQMPATAGRSSTSDVQWHDDGRDKVDQVRKTLGLSSSSSPATMMSPPPLEDPSYAQNGVKVITLPPPLPPADHPPPPPTKKNGDESANDDV